MAVQNPFFGKRDNDAFQARQPSPVLGGSNVTGQTSTSTTNPSTASSMNTSKPAASSTTESGGSKLTVGPNIKLKGVEITDCDTLVVEGTVEATMDSRVIQITEQGAFRGTAEIDIAEIHGEFDGSLTVREKLVIFSTGKVTGKIRYGKVVIEEGGQLSGEISVGVGGARAPAASTSAVTSSTSSAASSSTLAAA
ncbi:MAG: polymer-forming cytoskeletal protein [Alicycliphilus sp.]|jgi:cytoskeletal protein CcmA (bactofilin family)|uniref:Polymer-forming cytoskeletal protein n=1 Tax=Diaphorobacter limosus TaxID=3036128 RepID=A0ABZ0J2U3_9BURK|nr:polymer-forming cytoskeletal protein [Diaphorobacter sp. Y-1]MBP6753149.1 polymer-forming cytoskeletal protein [Alicycliphilus sp.]MBP7329224.1 polymer-forming cytoskeletal protein [Alicycliphilus sp.]WOO31865.1 polymer-forming cytoskeletal protein [Diaphorobacter sp. Y-1]